MDKHTEIKTIALAFMIALVIGLSFFAIAHYYNKDVTTVVESRAKVLTTFGCLETAETHAEFAQKQSFTNKVFGFQLRECD